MSSSVGYEINDWAAQPQFHIIILFLAQMDRIFRYCLGLFCGLVHVLLAKGIIKLPLQRQIEFDQYSERKKRILLISAYALVAFCIIAILWNLIPR